MLHFMLDAYDSVEENTNDLMSVNECLIDVASRLNLRPVMPPFLVPYNYASITKDNGISAFVLLDGGHITIHTFPYRKCYFADIFAESTFSENDACKAFLNNFDFERNKNDIINRECLNQICNFDPNVESDFGPHYMITVNDVDMTMESIFTWLDELPPQINVKAISRPYVIYSSANKNRFISGMLVISKSHIAVHYDILQKRAYIDIFSCVFLEKKQIDTVLNKSFDGHYFYRTYVRGENFLLTGLD